MNNVWLKALKAIAEGYATKGCEDRLIVVENPEYQPDNGSAPNLVIDIDAFAALSAPPFGTVEPGDEKEAIADAAHYVKNAEGDDQIARKIVKPLLKVARQQSRTLTARDAGIRQAREKIEAMDDWSCEVGGQEVLNAVRTILNESCPQAEGEKG